ncbi:MAG TPA: response regulator transcription factor [Pyrinomonadaceae bacterium]|jgi:DNA-binding response OmpR family regulator|nr:response regulator transcription factor [Pyrinomonadaceae bacterium]
MPGKILIIEDEADIAESLRYNFEREGLKTDLAETGEKGLKIALDPKGAPSLVILDLMLPGMNGMEICRRLRREAATRRTPIIMLTAKAAETDKIAGLELGADDYIVKPFSIKEVVARVRAVLRRADEGSIQRYDDDKLSIDFADIRVVCQGEQVKLTRKEFALLEALSKSSGRVVTRQNLLDNVWGYQYFGDTRTLDVHIRRLRQKLGLCGDCIETVVGIGYRFVGAK